MKWLKEMFRRWRDLLVPPPDPELDRWHAYLRDESEAILSFMALDLEYLYRQLYPYDRFPLPITTPDPGRLTLEWNSPDAYAELVLTPRTYNWMVRDSSQLMSENGDSTTRQRFAALLHNYFKEPR